MKCFLSTLIIITPLFAACEPTNTEKSGSKIYGTNEPKIAEALYTPCAVIQDFLTRPGGRKGFSENPFADKVTDTPSFTYLHPEPIWVTHRIKIDDSIDKAEHTRTLFQRNQARIASRMDGPLHEKTISAYNQAQDETFSFSDCALLPVIHTRDSDRLIIKERAAHNSKLYELATKFEKEYILKQKETGEKYDPQYAFKTRSNILKDRQNYNVISISRIGINREDKQAILYSENVCGRLCGAGLYIVLELSDHRWKVVSRTTIYVS